MSFFRLKPRVAAVALLLAAALAPSPVMAQAAGYKPHMENGVKLYNDRNYPAAIAEFKAAYEARPSPNPLVNIALCEKALFDYPKAIAALEQALQRHGGAMDAADRKAAEDAIKEMRALLGTVRFTVMPPSATVVVDGELVPGEGAARSVELGPGSHRIEARAEGFAPMDRTVTVASGRTLDVAVVLLPEVGNLKIEADDPTATITIDGNTVAKGSWTGVLTPGPHAVRIIPERGEVYEKTVDVVAGKESLVHPPPPPVGPRRGLYLLATGSILFPLVHPPDFESPQTDFGAGYGLRVGFQINDVAGFDLSYQHSSIQTYKVDDVYGNKSYRLVSERIALGLRMITPGTTWRFVGWIGGGLVYDQVLWGTQAWSACPQAKQDDATCTLGNKPPPGSKIDSTNGPPVHGFDAFGVVEAMAELDVDRVLIDLGMEFQFQATGGVARPADDPQKNYQGSIWGAKPILHIGPALRIGYRFW